MFFHLIRIQVFEMFSHFRHRFIFMLFLSINLFYLIAYFIINNLLWSIRTLF